MESLILVPIGAALYSLGNKVSGLREEVASKDIQIERLQQQVKETERTGGAGSSGSTLGKVALFSSVAVSASLAVYSTGKLWARGGNGGSSRSRRRRTTGGGETSEVVDTDEDGYVEGAVRVLSAPPAGYQPTKAASDQDACIVCLHNTKDTLVMPCSHMALCWVCAEALASGDTGAGSASAEPQTASVSTSANNRTEGGETANNNNHATTGSSDSSSAIRLIRRQNATSSLPPQPCPVCRGEIKGLAFAFVS